MEKLKLEHFFIVKSSRRTGHLGGGSVGSQLLELGLVEGKQVPASEVVCQAVVKSRNVESGELEIVLRRQKTDLAQAKLHAECSSAA